MQKVVFLAPPGQFRVRKTSKTRVGWHVEAVFSICLHSFFFLDYFNKIIQKKDRDLPLLKEIQAYFGGVGRISQGKNCAYFVSSLEHLTTVIIPHFVKYPLITHKLGDFLLFKAVVDIIKAKEHLTMKGIQEIVSLKASLNLGLTDELKAAFPDTVPALRLLPQNSEIMGKAKGSSCYEIPLTTPGSSAFMKVGLWMAGFVSGEGCFSVTEYKSSRVNVRLVFSITQHSRDESLIRSLVDFFGCGAYRSSYSNRTTVGFECTSFSSIYEIILPFFREYSIRGEKYKDFED